MKKIIATAFAAAALTIAAMAPANAAMSGLSNAAPAEAAAPAAAVQKVGFRGGRFRVHFRHRFGHRWGHRHFRYYGYRRYRGCGYFYRKWKWTGSRYWLRRYRVCKGWY